MLTKWLPTSPNKLPSFASHFVGVGGLVLDKQKKNILCVQERKSMFKEELWKLPGGLVETGESLETAVVREVWEETGIKAKF
jgi:8-oxo-dGTP pyrophosphatase MutT (NUDIX family)